MKGLSLKIQRQRGTPAPMAVADRFRDGTPVDERYVLRSVDPPANIRELTLQDGRLSEVAQPVTDGIEALAALERAHAAYNRRITDRPFDQDTD